MTLRGRVFDYVRRYQNVSFVELVREFPEAKGDFTYYAKPSIVLWHQLSESFCAMLQEMLESGDLVVKPCPFLVYFIDGAVPQLPLAKRLREYKKAHWLPVTFTTRGYRPSPRRVTHA